MKTLKSASGRARRLGLGKRWPEDRFEATKAIRDMGEDAIPFLLEVIRQQARDVRLNRLGCAILTAGTVFCYAAQIIDAHAGIWMFVPILLNAIAISQWGGPSTRLQTNAGALFAQLATREQIGTLIYLLDHTEGNSTFAVRLALTRMFSQVQASNIPDLSTAHRQILVRQLVRLSVNGAPTEADFTIALLRALQQIGDGSFVEPVKCLTRLGAHGLGARVRAAAEDCLPYLEAFAEQEQKSGTLVRAASSPEGEAQSAILLRPATTRPDSAPGLLLRPAVREETE